MPSSIPTNIPLLPSDVWTTAETVHVSVHNQGASIPSADTQLLFRPYTRLQGSNGRQGSGLGLFITKSIIEAHGGTLQLEPNKEEEDSDRLQGTTFSFRSSITIVMGIGKHVPTSYSLQAL